MLYVFFIVVTFILFFVGHSLYAAKHFASGTILVLFGLGFLFCLINEWNRHLFSFDTYCLIKDWLKYIWPLSSLAFIVKACKDNSRYEKEEARRREEESKKPVTINFKITSTTVEKN